MLTELRIKNFAIIDELELEFSNGLVTLTGETGAGKSIILDAILAVMGGRMDSSFVRSGEERAIVEATFRLTSSNGRWVLARIREEELEDEDDGNLITLTRELRSNGRTVARVNGRTVTVGLLKELGELLVDIHGQAEHLSLLNTRKHIDLLDRYADVEAPLAEYQKDYQALHDLRKELHQLREMQRDAARRTDLLNFQADEIELAVLTPGEDDELKQERDRLANAESLSELANQSVMLIEDASEESPAISDLLGEVVGNLAELSRIDKSQEAVSLQAELLLENLSDLGRNLRDYLETVEYNPQRLNEVEDRLDLINRLKRKYGDTIEKVLAFGERCRVELETIVGVDDRIEKLSVQEQALLASLSQKAILLSARRQEAGIFLANGVETELDDLNMSGARFRVDLHHKSDEDGVLLESGEHVAFNDLGIDHVEFMIAPNIGEGFKPLVKIASGGETARLMLALKNVLVRADTIPTLIFDEIDQGIGGRVGMVVGEKLWQLSRAHQVLCVTHLPQLAAFGDVHFKVQKGETGDQRTTTHVQPLVDDPRRDELAEMLGEVSEANRVAAVEILLAVRQRQEQLLAAAGEKG